MEGETEPWRLSSPCDHIHIHEQGLHTASRGAEREQEGEEENTKHRTARDWCGWPHRGQVHLVPERGKETRFMLWRLYHN